MLPAALIQLVSNTLGHTPRDVVATAGGFSHLTVAATLGGTPVVLKAASQPRQRADLRREALLLGWLSSSQLPVPHLLGFAEDSAWAVVVLQRLDGINGLQWYGRPPTELAPLYTALGQVLAQLHQQPAMPTSTPPLAPLTTELAQVHTTLAQAALPADLWPVLASALCHPIWQARPPAPLHGDAGLHNILWNGQLSGLLDWEWASFGTPLLDLAWVGWTMHWRQVAPALWPVFLEAYGLPISAELRQSGLQRTLALGQIGRILLRVIDRPAAWEEWLRRTRWTTSEMKRDE